MDSLSLEEIIRLLQLNKQLLYERFGVTRIGIFGSFARGEQTPVSDLDIVVDMERSKKNIHSFLELQRYLEKKTARRIDLGFEDSLKTAVRERIRKEIVYV
jgi:predicted nucleotidyltransferase